jgi:cell division septation protein DedD
MAEGRSDTVALRAMAALLATTLALGGCATRISATAGGQPLFRADSYGSRYGAQAAWYTPRRPVSYVEVGLAGAPSASGHKPGALARWWARTFHRKARPHAATTYVAVTGLRSRLPTPSVVEITNLATGATIRARVEARAALRGQVIRLSEDGLRQLGGQPDALLRVRVRYAAPVVVLQGRPELRYAWSAPRTPKPLAPLTPAPTVLAQAAPMAAKPAAAVVATAEGYRIQAGAFASAENAKRAAERLLGLGRATVEPTTRADGMTFYRVLVAGLHDEQQARAVQAKVAELGFTDARLLRPL